MIKYLLGIDGGGTKTEFLLSDLQMNTVKSLILGTANPSVIGIGNVKEVLKKGITDILTDIPFSEVSLFAGISGTGSSDIKAEISAFLSDFGFGAFSNGSDTESALALAAGKGDGIAVIMGTGIVALGKISDNIHRAGGWGYMIDKGGSGFSYGADALNSAFSYLDGRDGSNEMLTLIEKKAEKPLPELIPDIYSKGPSYVASFATVVFEAYLMGDKKAEEIIDRNSKEVSLLIEAVDKSKDINEVSFCGGLCRQKEILIPFLKKYLKKNYNMKFIEEPVVNGALSIAKGLIQKVMLCSEQKCAIPTR